MEESEVRECSHCGGTREVVPVDIDRSNQPDIPPLYICQDCVDEIAANARHSELLRDWAPIEEDGLRLEWMACTSWVLGTGDTVAVALRRPGGRSTCAMHFSAGTEPTEEHARRAIAAFRNHLPED